MKDFFRKIAEIIIFVFIICISIVIFLNREQIENIGNIGYLGLFILCFLGNSTVLLPAPGLMLAASCALIMNPLCVALFAALGSSIGELVGYAFGCVTKDLSPKFRKLMIICEKYIRNESLLVFIFAVLPLPLFDVVGIYSGGAKMKLYKFLIICFCGKFIKMLFYTNAYGFIENMLSFTGIGE